MSSSRPQISAREAADRLKVQVQTLHDRIRKGLVPGAFKVFSRWRIDEATFEAWRRDLGDPNAKPVEAFDVDPLPFKSEGDAA